MSQDTSRLTTLNVWAVAFGGVVGWGSFIMPGTIFLRKAGPMGTLIAIEVAALIMIVVACNYYHMLRRIPSAAGPYAWTKAAFGERHALVCMWFQSLAYLVLVPQNATALALLLRILFRTTFQTGVYYRLAGFDIYSSEILLAEAAIAAFALLNLSPARVVGKVQTALALLLLGGLCVILLGMMLSPRILAANFSPLFAPEDGVLGIFSVLAVAPWAFMGFDVIPHLTDHFPLDASKRPKIIMDTAILCGGAAYVLLALLAVSAPPEEFTGWVEYIDTLPQLHQIVAIPTFYAAWDILGTAGLIILGLAALGAILTGILCFYIATSRLLYALAREGALPTWFGKVNSCGAPVNATLFIMGLSALAPFFGRAVLGWLVDMSSLGMAVAYGYTSLAARKFDLREGRRPVLSTLGFILSAFFALLLLIPGLDSSLSGESYLCLLLWGVMGAVFIASSRRRRGTQLPQSASPTAPS